MIRKGKCTNQAGCLLAYRGEEIMISTGDFNCPECGTPLVPSGGGKKAGAKLILIAGGVIALILIAALVAGVMLQFRRLSTTAEPSPTPVPALSPAPLANTDGTPIPVARAEAVNTPVNDADIPVRRAIPANEPTVGEPVAESGGAPVAAASVNFDPGSAENRGVKEEVLRRIDLMRTSEANKDKLYMSVERARQMGKLLTIPFASGRIALSPQDTEALKRELQKPQVQQLLQDPTAVFVILGFADTKGNADKNMKISEDRAQSVLSTLRDKAGVVNVMHAVGMGGSTLFDPQSSEKNRVAEIWVVLP